MTSCSLEVTFEPPVQQTTPVLLTPAKPAKQTYQTPDYLTEREFFVRCVVLGAENTGKHSLINSSFSNQKENPQTYTRNDVDFVNKQLEIPYNIKRYHFWTFRVTDKSLKKEILWRAYYKSASAFIFVYDVTNADSFKRLEQSIQSVLKVIPRDEFFGILIGNKSDLSEQREVSYDAAVSFKLKYGFAHFFETNQESEKECPQILESLESRLKLTFESI